MLTKLLEFIKLLRQGGVRVSLAEVLDVYHALSYVELLDRELFKATLQTTLVKRAEDLPTFYKIFDFFFQVLEEQQVESLTPEEFQEFFQQASEVLQDSEFQELASQAPPEVPSESLTTWSQPLNYTPQVRDQQLYTQGTESELRQRAQEVVNSRQYEPWEMDDLQATVQRLVMEQGLEVAKLRAMDHVRVSQRQELEAKHQLLKQLIKLELEQTLIKQFGEEALMKVTRVERLDEVDLSALTEDQLELIKERIRQLARRLATKRGSQERRARRGRIDLRSTIRSSIPYGQVASELRFKRRRKTKPKLVVFCDVSGSVYIYVSFMLQLLLALSRVFRKVEAYVFVEQIKRITDELPDLDDDVHQLVKRYTNDPELGPVSDFGQAFVRLNAENTLDSQTVLLVIGDAVTYDNDPREDVFRQLTSRCKATYWLNPINREAWTMKGCVQSTYTPYCTDVFECRNLKQLEYFVSQLVKI